MKHRHRWIVAAEPVAAHYPAACACGAECRFPAVPRTHPGGTSASTAWGWQAVPGAGGLFLDLDRI